MLFETGAKFVNLRICNYDKVLPCTFVIKKIPRSVICKVIFREVVCVELRFDKPAYCFHKRILTHETFNFVFYSIFLLMYV